MAIKSGEGIVRQALLFINGVREQVIELPNFLALHNQGSLIFSSKNMNNFPKSLSVFVNYLLEAILAPFWLGRMPFVLDFCVAELTSFLAANPVPVIYFSIT